jgi:hypothetical protein
MKNEEKPLISMDKQYTRNGKKVRVLCVDRDCSKYPVVVLIDNTQVEYFTSHGQYHYDDDYNDNDCLKEYNPWQDVAVDTKVYVTYTFDGGDLYHKRHFSHYEASTGIVYVFSDGKTSYTSEPFEVVSTASAKLV